MKLKKLISAMLVMIMCFGFLSINSLEAYAEPKDEYWIKVNKKENVATVYEKCNGSWEPIRVIATSCGGANTPTGTFYTRANWSWSLLMGPTYGQYCINITGHYLFHSVWYYNNQDRDSQSVSEFNKLGRTASHGCVRVCVADAKWLYYHCPVGTKVTIYESSDPGPLGRADTYKMPYAAGELNWDPTDVSTNNPYYQALPLLTQKVNVIQYGSTEYSTAKSLVKASQINGKSIKSLSVDSITKYSQSKDKFVSAKYSSTSEGTYKIKYTVTSSKNVKITKTYRFVVMDTQKPVIKTYLESARSRVIEPGTLDAGYWLSSAKMANGLSVKADCRITVFEPDGNIQVLTYDKAKTYKFDQSGEYKIRYTAANANDSAAVAFKTITVTVAADPVISYPKCPEIEIDNGADVDLLSYVDVKACDGAALPDGSVSYTVTRDGENAAFDTTVPGVYRVEYTAIDSRWSGAQSSVSLTFVVKDAASAEVA